MIKNILAIETSCDDTSVSIVENGGRVIQLVSINQDLAHRLFGGVVPEIASRNHSLNLPPLIQHSLQEAKMNWSDIHGIAVTNRPGLIGSLIVGTIVAKTLAQVHQVPLIGINHLEGHLLAPFLSDSEWQPPAELKFPFVALAVSGGHTSIYRAEKLGSYLIIGRTKDDAAGEAFDKFGKMMGLGFPGGAQVDQMARQGDPSAFQFPQGLMHEENLMMSFSGMKSAAQRLIQKLGPDEALRLRNDLCASFQEAIVDVLLEKLKRAVKLEKLSNVVITGGVSANSRLRAKAQTWAKDLGLNLVIPPLKYCTDNAAMIGYAATWRLNSGQRSGLDLAPSPSSWIGDFTEYLK